MSKKNLLSRTGRFFKKGEILKGFYSVLSAVFFGWSKISADLRILRSIPYGAAIRFRVQVDTDHSSRFPVWYAGNRA